MPCSFASSRADFKTNENQRNLLSKLFPLILMEYGMKWDNKYWALHHGTCLPAIMNQVNQKKYIPPRESNITNGCGNIPRLLLWGGDFHLNYSGDLRECCWWSLSTEIVLGFSVCNFELLRQYLLLGCVRLITAVVVQMRCFVKLCPGLFVLMGP